MGKFGHLGGSVAGAGAGAWLVDAGVLRGQRHNVGEIWQDEKEQPNPF